MPSSCRHTCRHNCRSLEVVDESAQHAGHAGSRMQPGYSGETHFNVKVVSDAFEGLNTVKRHRTIYGVRILDVLLNPKSRSLAISRDALRLGGSRKFPVSVLAAALTFITFA